MSRGLRVLGHPLHAVLSDFPLALLGTSLVWDVCGLMREESVWWAISFWTIALGLALAVLAAMAGAVDYATVPQNHPASKTALRHMLLMLSALCPYLVSALLRGGPQPPSGTNLALVLALEAGGLLLLCIGGWYGGHLVFHYGIGGDAQKED